MKKSDKQSKKSIQIAHDVNALADEEDEDVDAAVLSAYDNVSQKSWDNRS